MPLVIKPHHRSRFSTPLDGYFRLRTRLLNDALRPRIPGPFAADCGADAFDHDQCLYLLSISADGNIWGGERLTPACAPNACCDVFQRDFGIEFPRDDDVYEVSHFCVDPKLPRDLQESVSLELHAAQLELSRKMGWRRSIAVGPSWLAAVAARWGLQITVLGGPVQLPGDKDLTFAMLCHEGDAVAEHLAFGLAGGGVLDDPDDDVSLFERYGDRSAAERRKFVKIKDREYEAPDALARHTRIYILDVLAELRTLAGASGEQQLAAALTDMLVEFPPKTLHAKRKAS
jgi:N-acyl-L-homoserine lactone synthetase